MEIKQETRFDKPKLKKVVRWAIFITLWVNVVHATQSSGIMSPAGVVMKPALGLMDLEYGTFSPMYAVGRVFGGICFIYIFNVVNRKYLMIMAAVIKFFTVGAFCVTNNGWLLLILRCVSGIGQVWPVLYGPLWVNQYAPQSSKNFMKNAFTVVSSLGRGSGFLINLVFGNENWRYGFAYNAIIHGICGLLYCFYPSIYFSSKLECIPGQDGKELLRPSQVGDVSVFNIRESTANEREINWCKKYSKILTNPLWIMLMLARCVLLAIRSVLQFWLPTYIEAVLGYKNKAIKTITFFFMIVFNPLIGTLLGKSLTKKVGGYREKKSIILLLILYLFAVIGFAPGVFFDDWKKFCIFASFFQIFGSAVLQVNEGIKKTCCDEVSQRYEGIITTFASNIVGSIPGPPTYGLINDYWKSYDPKMAMKFFSFYGFVGVFWVIIGVIIRFNSNVKEPLLQKKDEPDKIVGMEALDDINLTTNNSGKKKNKKAIEMQDKN